MCTNIVIHMNLSISIRRSISIHVGISITMSNFACLLGWSEGGILKIFHVFQDFPGQVPRIPRIPRFSWPSLQSPKNSKIFLAMPRNILEYVDFLDLVSQEFLEFSGFWGLCQENLGILVSCPFWGAEDLENLDVVRPKLEYLEYLEYI